jgi:hypothetical protein
MITRILRITALLGALAVSACGKYEDNTTPPAPTPVPPTPTPGENSLAVVVDQGPAALISAGQAAANSPFASVTLCTPGRSACETIDHLIVDTGSVGVRVLAPALSGTAVPKPVGDPATGSPLRQCVQFADGYTWGSVATADVQIGSRKLSSLLINLIGDTAAGPAPASCVSGPAENTVASFGANGVLGVGNFLHDCGSTCETRAIAGSYYVCPGGACVPTRVSVSNQLPNPVAAMAADNNGIMVQLDTVAHPGAASASGTLFFGVGTQGNNDLGGARLFTLDVVGTFTTNFNGLATRGFIDSGSNGYFFNDSTLPPCGDSPSFYCPAVGQVPTSVTRSASIVGLNGANATVGFTVDNADQIFQVKGRTAFPGLAGPSVGLGAGVGSAFDWGLPFFYGRKVFVLFEEANLSGTTGPAVGF